MLTGLSGSLVSEYFAETVLDTLFAGRLGEDTREAGRRDVLGCLARARRRLGPASAARAVYDEVAAPLSRLLGFRPCIRAVSGDGDILVAALGSPDGRCPTLVTVGWGVPLDAAWRAGLRAVIAAGSDWCFCANGATLRLADARRALARAFVEFDLDVAADSQATFRVLWGIARRASFATPSVIDEVVDASSRHTAGVCGSLRHGVLQALQEVLGAFRPRRRVSADATGGADEGVYEQALTVVYRLLFLFFAESRGLVPLWHPVYRGSYSMESLRDLAERAGCPRGLWEALQAMSRLAHGGCSAGTLKVTPFNGRLFSPSATPLGESRAMTDEAARRMVLALSTVPRGRTAHRGRIVYRDLGVEQLGAVYEAVLDYRPVFPADGAPTLVPGSGTRKATGSFYTPRSITGFLVRTALEPLVAGASPDRVLSLRVVDPAMGSGAVLVAACRFLARAYESAVVEHQGLLPGDIGEGDRRSFRRLVAQRCLYGVDRNPMAVQLSRLSLWLCTLAPERPLTFLDHRLVVGDSLVGASPDDLRRPPPGARATAARTRRDHPALPLFDLEGPGPALRAALPVRLFAATTPDDSVSAVREKERALAALAGPGSPLAAWRALADLWCAAAFGMSRGGDDAGAFFAVADALLRGRRVLPDAVVAARVAEARAVGEQRRFFHWALQFPEVFFDGDGSPRSDAGFDAVIGNPPWDMVRGDADRGADTVRREARLLVDFARRSGHYLCQGDGHTNLYQLFVERAFRLARSGGRLALVVPWGLAADRGCEGLRRLLFDRCAVDAFVGFENSRALFPIHRSVRFVAFAASTDGRTESVPCRLGLRDVSPLESADRVAPVAISRRLLDRVSAGDLSIPDVRSERDLALLEKLTLSAPALEASDGWCVEFGRELNATEDAGEFVRGGNGLPVLEGKHVEPFTVSIPADVRRLPLRAAARHRPRVPWDRARLAYRDVASATNRLTLIAAVIPPRVVTVHTLFCLRTPLSPDEQAFLCGILNSLVVNYLVRMRVTTHVTAGIVSRLPVPRPPADAPLRRSITELSHRLQQHRQAERSPDYPRLQAAVAALYELTGEELAHVVGTFPLVDEGAREATVRDYELRTTNYERNGE
jgi:hypothetical protein